MSNESIPPSSSPKKCRVERLKINSRFNFFFVFKLKRERKEKNAVLLKNVELSQNEERLKQQLRNESHEIIEMNETIQNLNDERHELESRINNCHQQLEGIDELKNEISEKNKVNIHHVHCEQFFSLNQFIFKF